MCGTGFRAGDAGAPRACSLGPGQRKVLGSDCALAPLRPFAPARRAPIPNPARETGRSRGPRGAPRLRSDVGGLHRRMRVWRLPASSRRRNSGARGQELGNSGTRTARAGLRGSESALTLRRGAPPSQILPERRAGVGALAVRLACALVSDCHQRPCVRILYDRCPGSGP